jgi:hypothetical protein
MPASSTPQQPRATQPHGESQQAATRVLIKAWHGHPGPAGCRAEPDFLAVR